MMPFDEKDLKVPERSQILLKMKEKRLQLSRSQGKIVRALGKPLSIFLCKLDIMAKQSVLSSNHDVFKYFKV